MTSTGSRRNRAWSPCARAVCERHSRVKPLSRKFCGWLRDARTETGGNMSPSAATRVEWSRRVAQALVETGQLAEVDANALLAESAATGTPFGSLAAAKGMLSPQVVTATLGQLAQLPTLALYTNRPSADAVQALPVAVASDYGAIGYAFHEGALHVAFGEPPSTDET